MRRVLRPAEAVRDNEASQAARLLRARGPRQHPPPQNAPSAQGPPPPGLAQDGQDGTREGGSVPSFAPPLAARTGQNARGPAGGETHLRGLGHGADCFPSSCCRRPCGRSGPPGPPVLRGPAARSLAPPICTRRGRGEATSSLAGGPAPRQPLPLPAPSPKLIGAVQHLAESRLATVVANHGPEGAETSAQWVGLGDAGAVCGRGRPGGGLSFLVLGAYLAEAGTAWWGWARGRGGTDRRNPGLPFPRDRAAARAAGGQGSLGRGPSCCSC